MTRHQLTVYLPRDLAGPLERLASDQGRSVSSLITEAVRLRLHRKEEGKDAPHLHRLEARLDKVVRDGVLAKEALLLFVRVWLEYHPPIDEELEESAAASAEARFERFLDLLAASVSNGRSFAIFDASNGSHRARSAAPDPGSGA